MVFESGRVIKFTRSNVGLYFYDTENKTNHKFTVNSNSLLQEREDLEKLITKKEMKKANKVRFHQELIGWPATSSMAKILDSKVKNSDVGGQDVENAEVLGEPTALPKGKMIRKHSTPHKTRYTRNSDPRLKYKTIHLSSDIMHTGKSSFW